jgi:hypothetical protein
MGRGRRGWRQKEGERTGGREEGKEGGREGGRERGKEEEGGEGGEGGREGREGKEGVRAGVGSDASFYLSREIEGGIGSVRTVKYART